MVRIITEEKIFFSQNIAEALLMLVCLHPTFFALAQEIFTFMDDLPSPAHASILYGKGRFCHKLPFLIKVYYTKTTNQF
jgi:hypothetical protein